MRLERASNLGLIRLPSNALPAEPWGHTFFQVLHKYFKTMLLWMIVFLQSLTANSLPLYLSKLLYCCKCLLNFALLNMGFCGLLLFCYELLSRIMTMDNEEVFPFDYCLMTTCINNFSSSNIISRSIISSTSSKIRSSRFPFSKILLKNNVVNLCFRPKSRFTVQ